MTRSVVLRELPPDHITTYDVDIQPLISADVRTVLAAPLFRSHEPADEPLGVLAFDSRLPAARLHFHKPEARELAQRWADIVSKLVLARRED